VKRLKLLVALVTFLAATATGMGATASPAGATPGCTWARSTYLNSGVSSASVNLEWCNGVAYLYGTIYDTTCDSRAAELEIWTYNDWRRTGMEIRQAPNGCGTSATYRVYVRSDFVEARLWTRACNTWGCSSSDSDWI
jgi:hypothetical protein